jgi:hypothetical protein
VWQTITHGAKHRRLRRRFDLEMSAAVAHGIGDRPRLKATADRHIDGSDTLENLNG